MRLNRRIGNPTSGGVGGRGESPSYSIQYINMLWNTDCFPQDLVLFRISRSRRSDYIQYYYAQ